ncbi:hypothetical protein LguiB_005105 [Lonicera macranthoides]
MAPEYAMHGQFSVKSDVFSFGVLVLEMVSGQRNNCFRNGENVEVLLSYAWKNWQEQGGMNLIDPILRSNSNPIRDIMRCIHIGLLCVQENVADRPTMASVVLMLSSFSLTLPVPSEPAFFMHSSAVDPEKSLLGEYNWGRSESTDNLWNATLVRIKAVILITRSLHGVDLEHFSFTLPVPSELAFFMHSSVVDPEKPLFGVIIRGQASPLNGKM